MEVDLWIGSVVDVESRRDEGLSSLPRMLAVVKHDAGWELMMP